MTHPTLTNTPVVMSISSHDPSGCAGISADIETLSSLGCHCTPIISKLAAQDTRSIKDSQITQTSLLIEQIRSVLEDITVDFIKIGELPSTAHIEAVHTILNDYPDIPVVLDPFWESPHRSPELTEAICDLLLPQAYISLMSKDHALQLRSHADTTPALIQELMELGCQHIFLTHVESASLPTICNQLFNTRGLCQQYHWPRLNEHFVGAGCTLSAALAAYLAHGFSLAESVQQAQQFTHQAITKGRRIGMGRLLPDRMHWANE